MLLIIINFLLVACEEQSDYSSGGSENDIVAREDDAAEIEAALEALSNEELKALVEARHEPDESPMEAEMGYDDMLTTDDIIASPYPSLGATLPYDGQNPETSSCKDTSKTAAKKELFCNGRYYGVVELRYSTACRTVWARLRGVVQSGLWCKVHRNSDGKELPYSHRSSDGKTVWTNMLNDKNVTSKASGGINTPCGNISGQTGSYITN